MDEENKIEVPPLGLLPRKYHIHRVNLQRIDEISKAISRYYEAGRKINLEWIEEYNELCEYFNQNKGVEDRDIFPFD